MTISRIEYATIDACTCYQDLKNHMGIESVLRGCDLSVGNQSA